MDSPTIAYLNILNLLKTLKIRQLNLILNKIKINLNGSQNPKWSPKQFVTILS